MIKASIIASLALLSQEPGPANVPPPTPAPATVGPQSGSLVIVGGGQNGPDIIKRFVTLAGGKDAEVVVIPTAAENDPVDAKRVEHRQDARAHAADRVRAGRGGRAAVTGQLEPQKPELLAELPDLPVPDGGARA